MCGIAGFIYKDKGRCVLKETVGRMLDTIEHRGPDGKGVHTDGCVGLGMCRLSVIDQNTHTIPYLTTDGSGILVYNGEVYNHNDIKVTLKNGNRVKYNSDAEIVMYAMHEKGIEAVKEFNGMYAFAFYHVPSGKMTLVRDMAGEKPLYYYEDNEKFVFASEIKAILAVVLPEINDNEINYRCFEICCSKETLFKNIFALEPGDYVEYENGNVLHRSYWKAWEHPIELPDDEAKVTSMLAELIEDAILLRLKNNAHDIGCLVSGGVDSALVACIAKPDFIYTGNYDINKNYDELHYAQMVAKHINKELVVVKPTKEDYIRYIDDIVYHLDLPATWTSFNMYMVLKRAREDIKVILSGEGVDELFGGYHRYHLLNHDQKIFELDAMQEYSFLINKYYGSPESRYAKLINRNPNQHDIESSKHVEETVQYYFGKTGSVVGGMGLTDYYTSMQILLTMADRMAMAFSIENRSPFLDHRLIQFAFSLSDKYKIKNGITKYIIKMIAKKFIPIEIAERVDKRGFVAPVNLWFDWTKNGQFDRSGYKNSVYTKWKKTFIEDWPNYCMQKVQEQKKKA